MSGKKSPSDKYVIAREKARLSMLAMANAAIACKEQDRVVQVQALIKQLDELK